MWLVVGIVSDQSEHSRHAFMRQNFWKYIYIYIYIFIQLQEKSVAFAATVQEDIFKKSAISEPLNTLKSKLQEGRTQYEWQDELCKDNYFTTH